MLELLPPIHTGDAQDSRICKLPTKKFLHSAGLKP